MFNWIFGWSWTLPTMYTNTKIILKRIDVTDHGVFGQLSLDTAPFTCVTLERHDIDIPAGTYKITLYQSPEHGLVPLLQNVPNRTMIEIHEGNFEHNSKGCILVGENRGVIENQDAITNSKLTLAGLLAALRHSDDIRIEIS